MKKALIVVDVQNDFCEGGSLAVPDANKIIPVINSLLPQFELVIFTQDWHPDNHCSFGLWPTHCVQYTPGAEIHKDIDLTHLQKFYFFKKGMDQKVDSYSAFYDNDHKTSTGLTQFLKENGVDEVFICGIAGDICCYYTALDAANEGFETNFIEDACAFLTKDKDSLLNELSEKNIWLINAESVDLFIKN